MKAPFGEEVYLKTEQGHGCRLYGCNHLAMKVHPKGEFCTRHWKQIADGEIRIAGVVPKPKEA